MKILKKNQKFNLNNQKHDVGICNGFVFRNCKLCKKNLISISQFLLSFVPFLFFCEQQLLPIFAEIRGTNYWI